MDMFGTIPPGARHWLSSGCAIHSLLIVYGCTVGNGAFHLFRLCVLLATLNLAYAVASTSWLLYNCFRALSYISIPLACVVVMPSAATFVRYLVRTILRRLNLTEHKIAYFHPPALRIDTEVSGLFVVRGLTFNPSILAIEAHGIEAAVQLSEKRQLALYADLVTIHLTRYIDISEIYATLREASDEAIFPGLSSGSKHDGPARSPSKLADSTSGGDEEAQQQYDDIYQEICVTSPIHRARRRMEETDHGPYHELSKDGQRAAICGGIAGEPAVLHCPQTVVRVTTLQNLLPRWLARFAARLPVLLRLLLLPLSYLHPINIPSITVAVPGHWLAGMLHHRLLDHYMKDENASRDLQSRIGDWLEEATFSLDFTGVSALGQVPLRTMHDIVAQVRCAATTIFRTAPDAVESVVTLGGADAEFTIPSYLLPHHEHLVPEKRPHDERTDVTEPKVTLDDQQEDKGLSEERPSSTDDQAQIAMRIHATLPGAIDHSLLEFFVDLANHSHIFSLQAGSESSNAKGEDASQDDPEAQATTQDSDTPGLRDRAKRAVRNHVKDRGKQLAKRGLGDDQSEWIKTVVRNAATQLERMHGDVGYSGSIPVPLQSYRGASDLPSKIWP